MLDPIVLNLEKDKDFLSKREEISILNILIKSHDVDVIKFVVDIEGITQEQGYRVQVLSLHSQSKNSLLYDLEPEGDTFAFYPDPKAITANENVRNYIYIYHGDRQSLDFKQFNYIVDLSEIDRTSTVTHTVYDANYHDLLQAFENDLALYRASLPDREDINTVLDGVTTTHQEIEQVEADRASAEAERVSAESARASAEAERVSDESARVSSEEQRKTDHANRSAEFDGKADKVVIENLVENGDFSDGLEGWLTFSSTNVVEDSILKNTGDGELSQAYLACPFNFQTGDVYYMKAKARVTNPLSTMILLGTSVKGDVGNITEPIENKWYLVSGIIRATNEAQIRLRHYYDNPEVQLGKTMEVIEVQNINLTTTFGAGNEPTKEQMDRLIEITGYIDGEYALNNKEMLGYLMKGISEKADKVVIKNQVVNGDFNQGTTGWEHNAGNLSVLNNELTVTATASITSGTRFAQAKTDNYSVGDKLYYRFLFKPSFLNTLRVTFDNANFNILSAPIIGSYNIYSGEYNVASPNIYAIGINYYHGSENIGKTYNLKQIIVVNRTKVFGAGNEPTKEEMDELIKVTGYIDGEYALNNQEMLGYLMKGIGEKANKKQEDWITPTLLNGWSAIRPSEPPQYMKDEFGFVHFRGAVSKGENATSNIAFQLPTGYCPNASTSFGIPDIANNPRSIAVSIFKNGVVDFAGAQSNSWYAISYITFKVV